MTYHIRHTLRVNEDCDGHWIGSYKTKRELNREAKDHLNCDRCTVEIGVGIYDMVEGELMWICDCADMSIAEKLLNFLNKE